MFVCCECCVLSGRSLCEGLITRPEESYRLWLAVVCDKETSKTWSLKPVTGLWKIQPQWVIKPGKQTNTNKEYSFKVRHSLIEEYSVQCASYSPSSSKSNFIIISASGTTAFCKSLALLYDTTKKALLFVRRKLTPDPSAIFHTATTSCCRSKDPYIVSKQDGFKWLSMMKTRTSSCIPGCHS
jgi:hypothetical protein